MLLRKIKIFLLIVFLSSPYITNSQIVPSDITLTISPSNPKPNQTATAKVESFFVDLDKSEILWYINEELLQKDFGKKSFSFPMGALSGKTTNINVVIVSSDGTIQKNIKLKNADVDLLWEAQTLTPPFYKGKALNSHQATIKITAIPHLIQENGKKISANNLIYKWKIDRKNQVNSSGYNKQSLTFTGPQTFREMNINVEVENIDGTIRAKNSVRIKNNDPKIIFYEDDPIFGIKYNKSVQNNFDLKGSEVSIIAFPYFFSKEDFQKTQYLWSINNKEIINDEEKPNYLSLRQESKLTSQTNNISLETRNIVKIMQSAQNSFKIKFGGEETRVTEDFFGF
ncbi:hypothetical protein ACFLY7_00185 [Patescibacteria group bacterium]